MFCHGKNCGCDLYICFSVEVNGGKIPHHIYYCVVVVVVERHKHGLNHFAFHVFITILLHFSSSTGTCNMLVLCSIYYFAEFSNISDDGSLLL